MSAPRYYVVAEEVCGDCGGAGVVPNPAWEVPPSAGGPRPGTAEFWRAHGPEELPCGGCEGQGKRTRRADLGEALATLGLPPGAARA